jgi:hypothetical protein
MGRLGSSRDLQCALVSVFAYLPADQAFNARDKVARKTYIGCSRLPAPALIRRWWNASKAETDPSRTVIENTATKFVWSFLPPALLRISSAIVSIANQDTLRANSIGECC